MISVSQTAFSLHVSLAIIVADENTFFAQIHMFNASDSSWQFYFHKFLASSVFRNLFQLLPLYHVDSIPRKRSRKSSHFYFASLLYIRKMATYRTRRLNNIAKQDPPWLISKLLLMICSANHHVIFTNCINYMTVNKLFLKCIVRYYKEKKLWVDNYLNHRHILLTMHDYCHAL